MANSIFLFPTGFSFTGTVSATSIVVTQGSLAADAQAISTTATWTSVGTTYTGWKENITDTASASASLLLDLQVGAVSKFSVRKDGLVTSAGSAVISGNVQIGSGTSFLWGGRSNISSPADGVVLATNAAGNDFTRLSLGGITSSFPAIARSGTGVQIVLADGSTFAPLTASGYTTGATPGVTTFGPSAVTSITVKGGIITAIS